MRMSIIASVCMAVGIIATLVGAILQDRMVFWPGLALFMLSVAALIAFPDEGAEEEILPS